MALIKKLDQGKLLLAEPFMRDKNFSRSVVLLCEHNEKSTFGLILNRRMENVLSDVMPDLDFFNAPLFYGGPVEPNHLHYLHAYGDLVEGSIKVDDGVYWGGDFERIKSLMAMGGIQANAIRFYVGYSGWDPGQLKEEMKESAWIVTDNIYRYVFEEEPDNLWRTVLRNTGIDEHRIMSHYPESPIFN